MIAGAAAHKGIAARAAKEALSFLFRIEEKHPEPLCVMQNPSQFADILADLGASFNRLRVERLA
jgi:hypothetical protein